MIRFVNYSVDINYTQQSENTKLFFPRNLAFLQLFTKKFEN